MPVTQQSGSSSQTTQSSGYTTSTGDPGTNPNASQTGYGSETSVYAGAVDGPNDALGAAVLGDATAFGTDTFANLGVVATASGSGVSASISAIAAAQSPDGGAFASASGAINFYGGADAFFGITSSSTYTGIDASGATVESQFDASIAAVQFSSGGTSANLNGAPPPGYSDCGCGDFDDDLSGYGLEIDGNLAAFDINASAFGDNTVVDVAVDALSVEDALSTVTAVVVVAIA